MPLFDFDSHWDWEEFLLAIPAGIPFIGKWYSRAHNVGQGNYLASVNPLANFWNMSEEDLAANIVVNTAGSYLVGRSLWWSLNFFEDYRALRFATSTAGLTAGGLVGLAILGGMISEEVQPGDFHSRQWHEQYQHRLHGGDYDWESARAQYSR